MRLLDDAGVKYKRVLNILFMITLIICALGVLAVLVVAFSQPRIAGPILIIGLASDGVLLVISYVFFLRHAALAELSINSGEILDELRFNKKVDRNPTKNSTEKLDAEAATTAGNKAIAEIKAARKAVICPKCGKSQYGKVCYSCGTPLGQSDQGQE